MSAEVTQKLLLPTAVTPAFFTQPVSMAIVEHGWLLLKQVEKAHLAYESVTAILRGNFERQLQGKS